MCALTSEPIQSRARQQCGFTLIEAMFVVGILTILGALAAPSFTSTIERFRVNSARDALANSIQLGRIEAIRTGRQVNLQQRACAFADWGCGWVMYVDLNADGVQNQNEPTLRQVDELEVEIRRNSPNPINTLSISRFGQFAVGLGNSFDIGPRDIASTRVVSTNCLSLILNAHMRQTIATGATRCP